MDQWLEVAKLDDIPSPGVVVFGYLNIALFRTDDNQVFALEDRCMHHEEVIAPDHDRSSYFPVKVEGGRIYISLVRQAAVTQREIDIHVFTAKSYQSFSTKWSDCFESARIKGSDSLKQF